MTGTIVNVAAIVVGSILGLVIRTRLKAELIEVIFQGIGLVTIAIGISMAVESRHIIVMAVSMVAGVVTGHLLKLEQRLNNLSESLRNLLSTRFPSVTGSFNEGFITASILFCVGSMAILGSIEEGLGHEPAILLTKSMMDGVCAIILAASLGVGVMFSALPVLLFQGCLTILALLFASSVPSAVIVEMTAVGGVLLIGLGFNLLKITKISILNMLPALVYSVAIAYLIN